MKVAELQEKLRQNHFEFIETIKGLKDDDFLYAPTGKWTAGQQLEHIVKSVSPVSLAFSLPGFLLSIIFGRANRPSRSYDELVAKYKKKLAEGGRATARFIPAQIKLAQREALSKKLQQLIATLNHHIGNKSEEQLDAYILPHPLLGKLTLREMAYFTIHHVEHHRNSVVENLKTQSA